MSDRMTTFFIITLLFVVAFSLRWEYVLNTKIAKPIQADAYKYLTLARNLANHHVFSMTADPSKSERSIRPPGYPMFLAVIVALTNSFNSFLWTTLFLQCLIGAGTVVLAYFFATSGELSRGWAITTALLTTFSPHLIVMSAYFLTECLYTFILLASLVVLLKSCRNGSVWLLAITGFFFSLASFIRPPLMLFPLFVAVIIYFSLKAKTKNHQKTRTAIVTFLLTSFLLPGGWFLGRALFPTGLPNNNSLLKTAFVCGTYPGITYKDSPGLPYRDDPNYKKLFASSYPQIISHVAKNIANDPGRHLSWWLLGKPVMFWSWKIFFSDGINFYPIKYCWFDQNGFMKSVRWLMMKLQPFLAILGVSSLLLFTAENQRSLNSPRTVASLICLMLLTYFTLMFMVLAPFPRYSLPLGPELFFLAVLTLNTMAIKAKMLFKA